MKKYFILAAAALAFAACSNKEDVTVEPQAEQQVGEVPVAFDAYLNRGVTRAGDPQVLTTGAKSPSVTGLRKYGFGVFSYYTDGVPYNENATPDFMYNQKVYGQDGQDVWLYEPIKYWPNEYGSKAESEGSDKLTFFAYAPYVTVIPGTGRIDKTVHTEDNALTSGIVGMTSNVASGDPYVKYYVDFDPDNSVDLCYGVAAANYSSFVEGTQTTIDAGKPYIDVLKPEVAKEVSSTPNNRIKFNFLHALASLNVQIDADVDDDDHEHPANPDKNTRIWVRSVTFEGFTDRGQLNLNSDDSEPLWYELSSTNTRIGSGLVTIYDGRREGKEPQGLASNEKTLGLNPRLIQSEGYQNPYNPANGLSTNHSNVCGVRKDPVNLFAANTGADDAANLAMPVFVIPTEDDLKVTIVYDVETYDKNLAGYLADGVTKGSVVENKITKTIKISDASVKLAAGKKYTIKLHLGMTSVQFDAAVEAWINGGTSDTDLPINKE